MFEDNKKKIMKQSWRDIEKLYKRNCTLDEIRRLYPCKQFFSYQEVNRYLYEQINEKRPIWIGRIGNTEMLTMDYYIKKELFPFSKDQRRIYAKKMCIGPGFFPNKVKDVKKYVELVLSDMQDMDILGMWNRYMEVWYIENYMPDVIGTTLSAIEPWGIELFHDESITPWTMALEGKKVLLIHPFVETMEYQYNNHRTKIFENIPVQNFLPQFDLKTLKAVQSIGGTRTEYSNWFDAFESMVEKCKSIDFDVAILGCGAYGFPLAAEIKRMGKCAIHMGGPTQLLFGIRGNRWDIFARDDKNSIYAKMINSYWVRPKEKEKVANMGIVENACYW